MDEKASHVKIGLLDQQFAANLRGDFDEGWRIAQILEKQNPADDRAAYNRGWHLLRAGDLLGGMKCLDRGRSQDVFGSKPPKVEYPQWQGEDLMGKTLLFYSEGGFGDEMINVRFVKNFADLGARVVVAASPPLVSLFRRVEGVAEVVPLGLVEQVKADYWVPGMSAMIPLGVTSETLPNKTYLSPDSRYVEKWRQRLASPGLKVGLRWGGNPRYEHQQFRSLPPERLFAMGTIPGVTVYSLQRDADLRDLPPSIVDLQHEIISWEDTAGAIANMDLVVTSCTSVAHLSAAMGKPTWIMMPVLSYYPWALPGDKSPWYPSARLFRQKKFADWTETLEEVVSEFEKWVRMQTKDESLKETKTRANAPEWSTETIHPSFAPTTVPITQHAPRIPGIFFAPKPIAKDDPREMTHPHHTEKKTMHFVAGLPRCGSTALVSLLAQNPRIFSAPLSGLAGILSGIYANWDKGEFHIEYPNPEAKRRVLVSVLENYHKTDRPIILDKNRQWVSYIAMLEDLLERPVKLIVPVRAIPEILASFEAIRRNNPLDFTNADESLGPGTTLEGRAQYYAGPGGPLGLAYNATKDAVTAGYLDRMLFVDYNKLTSAPKMQLRRIYEFLEEPYFEHDLGHVEQIAKGDWHVHKLPGLHDIRPTFAKDPKSARDILGDEVYNHYNQLEPWTMWT
jgi:hypothetical protein